LLHSKLNEMSERIRQLEDGLHYTHSARSSQRHPLLSESLLAIKQGVIQQSRQQVFSETYNSERGLESDILETFGMLRIGDDGKTSPSAVSEVRYTIKAKGLMRPVLLGSFFGTYSVHIRTSNIILHAISSRNPRTERRVNLCNCTTFFCMLETRGHMLTYF